MQWTKQILHELGGFFDVRDAEKAVEDYLRSKGIKWDEDERNLWQIDKSGYCYYSLDAIKINV